MQQKRDVELVVISDVHLGTYGARASELVSYLRSIQPRTLVLNGDIIDIWQFSKHYFPADHMQVLKEITSLLSKGTKVYYITGNHDEMLRKFAGSKMGSLKIVNKLVLKQQGEKVWIFHGDVFDVTMQHARWLAKLGAVGYDTLILINRAANFISTKLGRGKISLSKKIKNSVKSAVKFINSFEQTAADIGISNGYDYVVCGHIHQPEIRTITNEMGSIVYMNSGDWIENLTSLEYHQGTWKIYKYQEEELAGRIQETAQDTIELNTKELFASLVSEFSTMQQD